MNEFRTIARLGDSYDFGLMILLKSAYYESQKYEALFLKDDNEALEVFSEKAKGQWPLTEFLSISKFTPHEKTIEQFQSEAHTEEVQLYQKEFAEYQRLKAKFEGE